MKVRLGDIEVGCNERGDGRPVVFLHGLAEDRRHWAAVQSHLAGYRTYAYDLRGHGETSLGDADGSLVQLGQDLIDFLEAVTGPAPCVGYSLGGAIVLCVAARRPDLVPQAIVSGTSSVVGRGAAAFFRDRIETIESDFPAFAAALKEDTAKQFVTGNVDLEAHTARRLEAIGSGAGYVNAARAMLAVHEQPLTPSLSSIRCRVDVVGGDGDQFCPRKAAEIMVEALEDGVYHEIANAGHLMNLDQPAAYAELIEACLQGREG